MSRIPPPLPPALAAKLPANTLKARQLATAPTRPITRSAAAPAPPPPRPGTAQVFEAQAFNFGPTLAPAAPPTPPAPASAPPSLASAVEAPKVVRVGPWLQPPWP
jgi:hypothetical protein